MLLYNITLIIEDSISAELLKWMEEVHIPKMMANGKFVSHRLLKVLDSPNEGVTYCLQFVAENLADYESFKQQEAKAIEAAMQSKFPNKFVSFNTLMEFVD